MSELSLTLVYFIYGLAFFSMGIVMLLEAGRSPLLGDKGALILLAVFGFIHAFHEWIELAIISEYLGTSPTINWLRILILAGSFFVLFMFGLRVIKQGSSISLLEICIMTGLFLLYIFTVAVSTARSQIYHTDWFFHLDALTRFILAVPAASLAGYAFIRNRSIVSNPSGESHADLLLMIVSFGFIAYALTQTVVPEIDVFPANIWNTNKFYSITGFPIQLVRGLIAVIITIGLLLLSQIAAQQRHKRLTLAENARIEALEQAQKEAAAREKTRGNLLKHIVIAQEEQRSSIARELHDETSQLLTAINLKLESLRLTKTVEFDHKIDELQNLRKRVSEGIYRIMSDLRPAQLDDFGLIAALQSLVVDLSRDLDIKAELEIRGKEQRLDLFSETVLYRVTQEALTNVARHAGVPYAKVQLIYASDIVEVQIIDKGRGFTIDRGDFASSGYGLAGMQERVEAAGGQLSIKTEPGEGTMVSAIIPVPNQINTHAHGDNSAPLQDSSGKRTNNVDSQSVKIRSQ